VRRASLCSLVLASALLSGCASTASNGEASRPAARILADVEAAAGASSLRVVGSVAGVGPGVSLELRLHPGGAAGRIVLAGSPLELVALGSRLYLDAPASFWRRFAGGPGAARLAGRWVAVPAPAPAVRELRAWTTTAGLLRLLFGSGSGLVKGKFTTVRGERAFTLRDLGSATTLAVAAQGPPLPLELSGPGRHRLAFLRWNGTAAPSAPSGAVPYARLSG
jgi:hypothetical protein